MSSPRKEDHVCVKYGEWPSQSLDYGEPPSYLISVIEMRVWRYKLYRLDHQRGNPSARYPWYSRDSVCCLCVDYRCMVG